MDISVSEEHADVLLIFQSIQNKFGIVESSVTFCFQSLYNTEAVLQMSFAFIKHG
jgi:hypothetical protein